MSRAPAVVREVSAFAPATVANVAVGFDLLGFPCEAAGDEVRLERLVEKRVEITSIGVRDPRLPADWYASLSRDPRKNTATIGLLELMKDQKLDFGFRMSLKKGIPMKSGMGGSAASGVAALVAANEFLPTPLSRSQLLRYAVMGEAFASGSAHPDNVSPCLFGGLTLTRGADPVDVVFIPVPRQVRCALVHPHLELETRAAREVLRPEIPLRDHVRQSANLAGFIAGCFQGDLALIGRSLKDLIVEPQRARLVPRFPEAQRRALENGALGCSLSGSGPSVFAWFAGEREATRAAEAMVNAFEEGGIKADSWVSAIGTEGARTFGVNK